MFQISLQNHRLVVQLPVAVTADLAQQGDRLLPHRRTTTFGTQELKIWSARWRAKQTSNNSTRVCGGASL